MMDYKKCKERIEKEIDALNLSHSPAELYDPIRYVLDIGGKRIRPCLLMLSTGMFTDEIENSIYPAMAIEVFHNFTLLHDDIMDNAVLRRNHPAVHIKWDNNVAILSGDAMLTRAYDLLSNTSARYLPVLFKEFNKCALEVCEGQMFDMNYEKTVNVTVDEYMEMIRLKTSVLIASSLKMGAILGGAGKTDQELVYNVGLNLGIGFQLQDDYLDTFGESTSFGKKIGGDIVANKKTFLLTTALAETSGKTYLKLVKLMTTFEFSREEKIEQALEIFNEAGIKEKTKIKIEEYFKRALESLKQISVNEERKGPIKEVVEMLINRNI